jgi:hypothetical protein
MLVATRSRWHRAATESSLLGSRAGMRGW